MNNFIKELKWVGISCALALCVVLTLLLLSWNKVYFNANSFQYLNGVIEIQMHDTYLLIEPFHVFVFNFLHLAFVINIFRLLKLGFGNLFTNVFTVLEFGLVTLIYLLFL